MFLLQETSELFDVSSLTSGFGVEEARYIISKLINMTVNQATISAQRQASITELEGKMKQVFYEKFIFLFKFIIFIWLFSNNYHQDC